MCANEKTALTAKQWAKPPIFGALQASTHTAKFRVPYKGSVVFIIQMFRFDALILSESNPYLR